MEIVGRHSYNQLAKFQIGNRKVQNVSIYFLYLTSLPNLLPISEYRLQPRYPFQSKLNFKRISWIQNKADSCLVHLVQVTSRFCLYSVESSLLSLACGHIWYYMMCHVLFHMLMTFNDWLMSFKCSFRRAYMFNVRELNIKAIHFVLLKKTFELGAA